VGVDTAFDAEAGGSEFIKIQPGIADGSGRVRAFTVGALRLTRTGSRDDSGLVGPRRPLDNCRLQRKDVIVEIVGVRDQRIRRTGSQAFFNDAKFFRYVGFLHPIGFDSGMRRCRALRLRLLFPVLRIEREGN
jgi:hypothetical protein